MRNEFTRRTVLQAGLSLPLVTSALPQETPEQSGAGEGKSLLVLGGTRFLGPAIVDAALARGYEVTLFNRGKSNPNLYPELEKLRGDRNTGDLDALQGRKWDIVADTSAYLPSHARATAELLADNVDHYVLISTVSVYEEGPDEYVIDENSPVLAITDEDVAKVAVIGDVMRVGNGSFYGPLKVLCEQEVAALFPGRFTSLRPGVIAGREDPSDRFPYWVVRVGQGGEILAPGDPDQDFQFTDVQDLGEWTVEFGEKKVAGIYNSIGFPGKVTLQEFLHGCKVVLGSACSFTWADEEFLLENDVRPFSEMPFWLPKNYAKYYSPKKGIAAGMHFRPVAETIRSAFDWHHEKRDASYKWRYYGMQPEREAELLALWNAK